MIRIVNTYALSNGGTEYNVLPSITFTPQYGVAAFWKPSGLSKFPDPIRAKKMYPVVGMVIAISLGTYHAGIELRLRSYP